jgi:hypothetical protein
LVEPTTFEIERSGWERIVSDIPEHAEYAKAKLAPDDFDGVPF